MLTYKQIPAALRYPGVYIEVDGSRAGLGTDMPAMLLVGQKLATGTAAAGEVVQISSVQDAINKFGAGSALAQMAAKYRAIDTTFDLWALPYADSGVGTKATGTLTVTAAPTAAGVLSLYIAGRLVQVAVTATMVVADVAAAIVAAITAADVPVTATAAAGVVTVSAKHKGTIGNGIDLRISLYGEDRPAGLAVTIVAMASGAGDPAPGDLAAILGARWFRYVCLGLNDAATLAAWHTESQRRYAPPIQSGFRIFTTFRGDYASTVTFGTARNAEHIAAMSLELNPTPTWEAAAVVAAAAAPKLFANPAQSLEDTPLPGIIGASYFDWTNANSLLFKGMSVMKVAKDGTCTIKRLVTMYQTKADGSADDAFLDINTPELMERIRRKQMGTAVARFTGSAAAKNNDGFRPGLRITTVDDVRAMLLTLYRSTLMFEYGWVQDYEFYKANLIVEQDPTNPSRFNYRDTPVLLSPFYILAGRGEFRKVAV